MGVSQRVNEAAYRHLRPGIDAQYPPGQYIAIDNGQIVDDAPALDELLESLQNRGLEPSNLLVVQAGVEPVTEAIILLTTKFA
jgi:hypothetical protein